MKALRTLQAGTDAAERYSVLTGELEAVEANRNAAIASTNAVADTLAAPILKELAEIAGALEPWWTQHGPGLTKGKRKSAEVGGCMLGTVTGRTTLAIADAAAAQAGLEAQRWAKPYLRTTVSIDKVAVLKGLESSHASRLVDLGFTKQEGEAKFFVKRAEQGGTVASA